MKVKLLQTNRMLRLLLCLTVAIMAANGVLAQSVSRATARRVAETFFIQNVKNGESQPVQFEDVTAETEFQNFYIFSADSGFVIVAGDERVIPILGYSKTSPFVTENMPENLRWWLEGYEGQIQEVMDNSIPATAEIATKWSCLKTGEAEPMRGNRSVELPLTTKWDQGAPYNDSCPITSGGAQCVTGCVATAIAQVLKYWNYPTQGLGSKTLEATQAFGSVLHPECYPIHVDFSATTYDWQNMDNSLTSSSPQEKIDAVATLMKHCGVAMNMNYGTSREGGSESTLSYADSICKYFDYSSCASFYSQVNYSDDEWIAMLKNEIDHSRPVLYRGTDDDGEGGHAFVFYGYSNDKFQVNWGWGGSSNGLYEIGRLNTSNGKFNLANNAVLYLMPNNRNLSAPDNVEIDYHDGVIHLSWSAVSGAVSYIILRDGSYLAEIEQTYYDDTECFGGNYTYSVIAVSADSHASLPSEEVTITIPYETPTVLSLTANTSENSVLLSWTEPSNALIPFYLHKQPFEGSEIKHKNSHAPAPNSNNSAITEPVIVEFFNVSKMGPNSGKYVTEVDIWVSSNSSFWSGEYYAVGKRHTVNIISGSQSESISFVPTSPGTKQLILQNPIRIERTFEVQIIIEGAGNDMVFDYLEGAENGFGVSYYHDEYGLLTRMPSGHHFIVDLYAKWANELTYNVYRNGVCIARNLQEPNYTDTNVPAGLCSYYVTTNYFGGESEPSETVSVSCGNCTITTTCSPSNGGSISGNQGSYPAGSTVTLVAIPVSGYTFSNWTENGTIVSTNATYSFTVTGNRTLVANFVVSGGSSHEYVDLGLPSGTLWATCNVGANVPEEYGDFFCWGETQTKDSYIGTQYGSYGNFTKYCNNSNYGHNGYIDNLTTLLPEDDAATANWGESWRTPTYEEWNELLNNTTNTWVTRNGVNGRLFTSSNGASLFLPAAGGYWASNHQYAGGGGYYWSSSLGMVAPDGACYLNINEAYYADHLNNGYYRRYGFSVRAVHAPQSTTATYIVTATPNPWVGTLTSEQQGQTCTLRATANTGYTFTNWTENGNVVSTNASYTFTVTGNRTLVANFRECSALTNLAVTNNSITSQNATVTWTGSDAGYIVQVMQYQATVFHESFENNGTTLPGGWTSVVGTGDGQWVVKTGDNSSSTGAHAGTYNVSCPHTSRNNTTYLISPAMDLSGTTSARLKFWMINRKWGSDIDECHVYYRVNGGDWNGPLFSTTEEHATWTEITIPLQGLATNYQIGFMSVDQWGYGLSLDDITVESCSWNTVYSSATSPYTFSGLTPNTTYSVRVLNICENASNVISFTTLDAHTLTTSVSPSASGSIACNPSAVNGVYDHGTQVRLTATANTGYTFKNWTENGAVVSTDASYTITMMGNRTLVANFVDNTANYTISASASLSNGGTVRGEGTYYGGTTCTLTASANDGYSFLNWTENGTVVSTESSYSFVVTGNRTLVANFVEGYLIGDGGDATNNYLPSYSYYKYSLTQQIYTADDIGTAGLITSIAFYNGGAEKTRTYDMYLVYTNKTIFDSDTDWVTVTEADKVFSDSMVMAANDWTVFVLDTPFAYNGTSNLAIIIDDNSGKFTSSPHMACRVFNANGNQAIRVYSDNTNYDPMSPPTSYGSGENVALHSVKNQIVFEILPPYHFVTSGNWGTASNWSNGTLPGANAEVFIDAPCQLNRNATVASLTVSSGQSLTLQSGKTLTVTNTLTNTATTGLVIEDGAQLMHASDNVSATVKKDIAGHGTGNGKFYLISNPLVSAVNPNLANVYFLTTGNYDLYSWLATAADHLEWRNFKDNAFTISPNGYGYLYANRSGVELNFPGILRPSHYRFAKSVSYNAGDAEHPGWNLIGNPFTCNAYLVNANNEPLPFYRMNAAGDGFEAVAPGTAVAPMEGIFYKTSGNGIVYFIRAD